MERIPLGSMGANGTFISYLWLFRNCCFPRKFWYSPWGNYLWYEGDYQEYRDEFSYNITFRVPDVGSLNNNPRSMQCTF